ncbi:Rho GTPase activation protein [Multifurca ochricompacta]|uniref:Rho GTPase activation protein n=1 Tax=Multifurca ochricompacta TaxID=376703 RepID=A0AAD4M996_9AGAM|nr:Rho GTPase activation protein [Multifurca ochricompacta]
MRNVSRTPSSRSSSELSHERLASDARAQLDSSAFSHHTDARVSEHGAYITVTAPDGPGAPSAKLDLSYTVTKRLQDALEEGARRGTTQIALDQEFVQAIIMTIEQRSDENARMKGRLDHIKRASQQAMDGLTVAHGEYEAELKARRDAEAEVTRLRVLLSGQAARITALSGEGRKDELHKQLTRQLSDNLSILEQNVSKLKVERDVALVEMEEIASTKSSVAAPDREGTSISRSLTTRLDDLKSQYQDELVSLTDARESLLREIVELKSARDVFLEETTMLNARNEELAQLHAHYMRRIEIGSSEPPIQTHEKQSFERQRPTAVLQPSNTVNSSFGTPADESVDSTRHAKVPKPAAGDATSRVFKWRGNNKDATAAVSNALDGVIEKNWLKHSFQQVSVLRFTKCDHCSDKLWGSQYRCQTCNISVHPRCQQHVQPICSPQNSRRDDGASLQPSMFGRELTEQVRADSRFTDKMVPLIVEKCIAAVDACALDYEGIYRKNGGSGQSKLIQQLFERGDYGSFDLRDTERFNDICSVTSVLKSYFRTLPNPLLTFVLHDEFIFASSVRDPAHKSGKYADLVKQLPTEHYYTLRMLMFHLHRIQDHHEQNLMTARNLGVVFGPTLMRSRNPGAEFSDMAGKALTIEWLVENAPIVFPPLSTSH